MAAKDKYRGFLYLRGFLSVQGFLCLQGFLCIAAAAVAAVLSAQTADTHRDQAAREQGWQIFQQARQAFRGGGSPSPIHDYDFALTSQLHTSEGVTKITSRTFFVYPDFVRQELDTPNGQIIIIFDGDGGWQQSAAGRRELPPEAAAQIQAELARNNVLIGPEPDPTLVRFVGRDEVEGRPADVVQIADVGGTLLRLFVDVETRDVLKHTFVGDTPQGLAQVEEVFSDFEEVAGYRWYQHRKVTRNGKVVLESARSNLRVNAGHEQAGLIENKTKP
jgi:type II secretory pathway pseudopilin PulG